MGLRAFLANTISTKFKKFNGAEGNSLELKSEAYNEDIVQSEVYHPHGFFSNPPKGVKHITIPVNGNRGHLITLGFYNYKLNIEYDNGAAFIYSTDNNGNTIKGKMLIDTDGKIGIANSSEQIATLISDLINVIINITTFGPPSQHALTPASIAALQTMNTRFSDLLKGI